MINLYYDIDDKVIYNKKKKKKKKKKKENGEIYLKLNQKINFNFLAVKDHNNEGQKDLQKSHFYN